MSPYLTHEQVDLPDISHHTLLRSLDLRLEIMALHGPPPWLFSLFSTVKLPNCLEEISLAAYISGGGGEIKDLTVWKDVDSVLAGPEFLHLRSVRLALYRNIVNEPNLLQISDDILAQFPNLINRGISIMVNTTHCPTLL